MKERADEVDSVGVLNARLKAAMAELSRFLQPDTTLEDMMTEENTEGETSNG